MCNMRWLVAICCVLLVATGANTARILALFPLTGNSHMVFFGALTRELARRGHDLTIVTPRPTGGPEGVTNYREIKLTTAPTFPNMYDNADIPIYKRAQFFFDFGQRACKATLQEPAIQQLIHSDEKFDLILHTSFFCECYLGFVHKFNTPVIQISPFHGSNFMIGVLGNPAETASMPDMFLGYDNEMNLYERIINTWSHLVWTTARFLWHIPIQERTMREHFGPDTPSVKELESRVSLLIINSDVTLSYSRALVPNVIMAGGMHIEKPKPLPKDLAKFVEESKNGVIVFSMGSNLKSCDLPPEKRDALLNSFAKLKENVIWKWEEDSLPGQPQNVFLYKWLPQNDVLAHPNVKLFITHGGLYSTEEALYFGKPMVGIPIFADQMVNMRRVEKSGLGVLIDFKDLTETAVTNSLKEVLENSKYTETAHRLSSQFRDHPQTPLERAVFWFEYVLRHNGAHHLRSRAADLHWYQRALLDIAAVLVAALALAVFLVVITVQKVRKLLKKKTSSEKQKRS